MESTSYTSSPMARSQILFSLDYFIDEDEDDTRCYGVAKIEKHFINKKLFLYFVETLVNIIFAKDFSYILTYN